VITKIHLARIRRMAEDVRRTLDKHTNVGLSAFNYQLNPTDEVAAELAKLLPDVKVRNDGGFMGYIHFDKVVKP
jgi:hypothetical protein